MFKNVAARGQLELTSAPFTVSSYVQWVCLGMDSHSIEKAILFNILFFLWNVHMLMCKFKRLLLLFPSIFVVFMLCVPAYFGFAINYSFNLHDVIFLFMQCFQDRGEKLLYDRHKKSYQNDKKSTIFLYFL